MIILTGTLLLVVCLIAGFWVVIAHEHGPTVADVVVGYELARSRDDWSTVFDLSGVELRGEFDRAHFLAAQPARRARRAAGSAPTVVIESETVTTDGALVVARVETLESTQRHALQCERRHGRWVVIADVPATAR